MSKLFHHHLERAKHLLSLFKHKSHKNKDATTITEYATLAGYPEAYHGEGITIGVIYLGGGYEADNLTSFFENPENRRAQPDLNNISVLYGENTPAPQDTVATYLDGKPVKPAVNLQASSTVEATGGLELIMGLAPAAKIQLYFAKGLNGDDLKTAKPDQMDDILMTSILDTLQFVADDTENRPDILSMSWAFGELPGSDFVHESYRKMDALLDKIKETTTMMCASGDYGSNNVYCPDFCKANPNILSVAYPASSVHVTACGGIAPIEDNWAELKVWNQMLSPVSQMASTGGVSALFTEVPAWQEGCDIKGKTGSDGRGVPDISALADSNDGLRLTIAGRDVTSGGTSASAPLLSSFFACIYQGLGRSLGYLNPYLYHPKIAALFHNVCEGNNIMKRSREDSFDALHNTWDACTGHGAPLGGAALLAALQEVIDEDSCN